MDNDINCKTQSDNLSKSELNLDYHPLNINEALEDSPMFRKSIIEAEEVSIHT